MTILSLIGVALNSFLVFVEVLLYVVYNIHATHTPKPGQCTVWKIT